MSLDRGDLIALERALKDLTTAVERAGADRLREVLAAELRPVLERLAELERWRASGPCSRSPSENT